MNAKTILIAIIFASILINLSLSQVLLINPLKDVTIVKEFDTSIYAGGVSEAIVYFKYRVNDWIPLVVRVNITPEDVNYVLNGNEFNVEAYLLSKPMIAGIPPIEYYLKCELPPISFEQTGDYFEEPSNNMLSFYCYNETYFYILQPLSENNLTIKVYSHPALKPARFNITFELMSEIGILLIEPIVEIKDGKGILRIDYPTYEYLEFYLQNNQSMNLSVAIYSTIFIGNNPKERPVGIIYLNTKNLSSFSGLAEIRYYFTPSLLVSKNLDVLNIRFYKLEDNIWKLVTASEVIIVNESLAYVYAIVNSFGIYGIFTSYYTPQPLIQVQREVVAFPTERIVEKERIIETPIYYNITNITQPIIERIVELPKPVCGNDVCEVGEDWRNCPQDCPTPIIPQPTMPTGLLILTEPSIIAIIIGISFLAALGGVYLGLKLFGKK